jgi:hypothetical protein
MKSPTDMTILIASFGLAFGLAGCDDDSSSSGSGGGGGDLGDVELTVRGDVEGARTGMADFHGDENVGLHYWQISMHDHGPQSFSLTLTKSSVDPIERPGVGTHVLDGPENGFSAVFTHIPDGDYANATEYSDVLCRDELGLGGTLTISSSSDEMVAGSFQFVLADYDLDETGCVLLGSVEVEGEFTAFARQF